jgi:hypothetical protein
VERGGESVEISELPKAEGEGKNRTFDGSDEVFVALALVEEGRAEEYGVSPRSWGFGGSGHCGVVSLVSRSSLDGKEVEWS